MLQKSLEPIFFYTNADEISLFDIQKMLDVFKAENSLVTALVKKDDKGYLIINNIQISQKTNVGSGTHIELGSKFIDRNAINTKTPKQEKFEDFIYSHVLKKGKVTFYEIDTTIRIDTAHDINEQISY